MKQIRTLNQIAAILLSISFTVAMPLTARAERPLCAGVLIQKPSKVAVKVAYDQYDKLYYANKATITGANHYPADVIYSNLGLEPYQLPRRVVSVGEGMSGFLPALLKEGVNASGVDIWYGSNLSKFPELQNFVKQNSNNLITGSAESIPLPANSVDMLVYHQVFHYLENPIVALKEALRVVKRGGEIRIFMGCATGECYNYSGILSRLKSELGSAFTSSIESKSATWQDARTYGRLHIEGQLIIIRKN